MRFLPALLIVLTMAFGNAYAQDGEVFSIDKSPLPPPTSPVMDYAGVMDADTKKRLEDRIIAFRDSSDPSVEIGVAVVRTTEGRDIFEYSLAVARGWGIGSREDDNPGALLFVAIDDRKYFTQISRDLEDELPDGLVGSLQREYLVPEFRKGNYSKGIEDTVEAYIRTIEAKQSGQPVPEAGTTQEYGRDPVDIVFDAIPNWVCRGICCLAIILFIVFIAYNSGGGGGGKGGGRKRDSDFGGDLLAAFLAGLVSNAASSDWDSGSSWGGSSSGWGGSSGGWGGFSGGGSFGGGGSGGSW